MFELTNKFETRKSIFIFLCKASMEIYEIAGKDLQDLFQIR